MEPAELEGKRLEYFKKAIKLFAQHSFDAVTLDDLADAVGRVKTNIYRYFSSKQEILDLMYDFFIAHFSDSRRSLEELKPIIEHGTVIEMIMAVSYLFPEPIKELMTDILTVIHQRKYFDEKARKIAKELMVDEGIRYAQEVFEYAINIGRLAPFNTYWLALLINDTRNGEYMRSVLDKDHNREEYIAREEMLLYQHAAALITDRRPRFADTGENESK